MDLKSSTPYIIGGVFVVGAVVLMSGRGAAPSNPGYSSALASLNANQSQQFAISTQARVALGEAAYRNSATVAGYFAGALQNIVNVQGQVRMAQTQSNGGIVSSILTNNAALAMDISNNAARVEQTGIMTAGQVVTGTVNARYSQQAAKDASSAGMFASLGASIASVANSAIKAAA